MNGHESQIIARGMFLRLGPIEISVREDGGLLIMNGPQRLELDRGQAEILGFMMRVILR
jgi:hypothetical protein